MTFTLPRRYLYETPEQSYTINTFEGGINEYTDPMVLNNTALAAAQNAKINAGVLEVVPGTTKFNITANAGTPIKSIFTYYKDGQGYVMASGSGKLLKLNTSTNAFDVVSSEFTNSYMDSVNYSVSKDIIIITNGMDNMKCYDGTTLRNVLNRRVEYNTDGTIKDYVDGNGNTYASEASITTLAPKVKALELHYERLWGIDDNKLYFSTANKNAYDIDDWTYPVAIGQANQHGGEIDDPTFDGSKNIGLKVVNNDIIVFKTKQVVRIFGTYPGNYSKDQLFVSTGTISDRSIAMGKNCAFFCDNDGIYKYDGVNVTKISDRINTTWATLNMNYMQYCASAYYQNHYILSVPQGTSTVNNLIIDYDIINDTFMFKSGFNVNCFTEYFEQLLFANEDGYIYIYNSGEDFNGSNIYMYAETGYTNLGVPNGVKTIDYCYLTGSSEIDGGEVLITFTSERGSKTKTVSLTTTNSDKHFTLRLSGRNFQFKIENVNGSRIKLRPPVITFEIDVD